MLEVVKNKFYNPPRLDKNLLKNKVNILLISFYNPPRLDKNQVQVPNKLTPQELLQSSKVR